MPGRKHVRGAGEKEQRMYEHIKESAQKEGRYKGRVPTVRRQAAEIARLKADGVTPSEIARRLGIGRASVYRVPAERTGGVDHNNHQPFNQMLREVARRGTLRPGPITFVPTAASP